MKIKNSRSTRQLRPPRPPRPGEFGGSYYRGRRKRQRPLRIQGALHVVLRSSRAKGEWSLLHRKNRGIVEVLIHDLAHICGVRVKHANVGNHIHLLIRVRSRISFQRFLRWLAGAIAMKVTGACKGNPKGKFWDEIAFSSVVQLGREYEKVLSYLVKNMMEAYGIWRKGKIQIMALEEWDIGKLSSGYA